MGRLIPLETGRAAARDSIANGAYRRDNRATI
jgi:hypothetical protein